MSSEKIEVSIPVGDSAIHPGIQRPLCNRQLYSDYLGNFDYYDYVELASVINFYQSHNSNTKLARHIGHELSFATNVLKQSRQTLFE